MDWQVLVANFINTVAVVALVDFLRKFGLEWLNEKVPWLMPILPVVLGWALPAAAAALTALLGYEIDFSAINGVFSGAMALVLHQSGKQYVKSKRVL